MSWQSRGDRRRRFKLRSLMLQEATTDFVMRSIYEAAMEVNINCVISLPCLQNQTPIILTGVFHAYRQLDQAWYMWFLTIISIWLFLLLACSTLWNLLHLDSVLHKMFTTSMLNFQHLSQLSILSPVKTAYDNMLVFTIFSYIEFWNVVPWKVLEKNSMCGESKSRHL